MHLPEALLQVLLSGRLGRGLSLTTSPHKLQRRGCPRWQCRRRRRRGCRRWRCWRPDEEVAGGAGIPPCGPCRRPPHLLRRGGPARSLIIMMSWRWNYATVRSRRARGLGRGAGLGQALQSLTRKEHWQARGGSSSMARKSTAIVEHVRRKLI